MLRRRNGSAREKAHVTIGRAVIEALEGRQFLHADHEHLSVKVDFQKVASPVFPGYVADIGQAYGDRNGYTYGWSANNTASARDRNASNSPDERYDTWVKTAGQVWEIALPNDTYDVRLVAGDPTTFDSYYKVNLEGVLAVDFQPTKATRWVDNTVTVTVSDGKLTLSNAAGSIDNKICFIEIATHDEGPAPTEPPAAPTGNDALAISSSQIRVRWVDNASDEDGYRIHRKLGDDGTWELIDEVDANETEYLDNGLSPDTRYVYRVLAFNEIGDSAFSNEDGSTTFENDPSGTEITWQTVAPSPIKRAEAQGGVVNGKLYVLGGLFVSGGQILATTRSDVYDPATNTWARIKDCPDKVTHSGIVIVGDTIWLIGGYFGDHPGPGGKRVWKYNTTTDTWSRGPDLPNSRGAGGAGLVGDKIYFFGGMGYDRTWSSGSTYCLDLNNQSAGWKTKASMPNPRNHTAGASVNGYVYAIGGQWDQEENQTAQRDIHRYDPLADKWEKVAELPTVRSHVNASTFVMNGKVIIVGGETGYNTVVRNVTVFDPITNTTSEMSPLPTGRSTSVAGVLPDGRLISATGNDPTPSTTTWIGTIS